MIYMVEQLTYLHTLKKLGIEVRYADPSDPKNFEKAIDERTRCFYAETFT